MTGPTQLLGDATRDAMVTQNHYTRCHMQGLGTRSQGRQKLQLVQLRLRSSSLGLLFSGTTRPKFSSQLAKYTDTKLEVVG